MTGVGYLIKQRADSVESALCFSGGPCLRSETWGTLFVAMLFGGEFFLLAFHAHCFELALFGVVRFLDFLLDFGRRFFELG